MWIETTAHRNKMGKYQKLVKEMLKKKFIGSNAGVFPFPSEKICKEWVETGILKVDGWQIGYFGSGK